MHYGPCASGANCLAQKRYFFGVGFHQVNPGVGHICKRAGNCHAGKSAAGAEVGPNAGLWREREQLEGVRDVAGPDIWLRGRRDEINPLLPAKEHSDIAIQAVHCFT